jgi:hypothetical protein
MGAERDFSALLRLQIAGQQGTPAGLRFRGGTPNHWALAAATAYGYGLKGTPAERKAGRQKVLDFFRTQDLVGHMARGRVSEFGTPSHFVWWQAALAGIWLLAARAKDAEVLNAVRTWWIRELTVENLCATPKGHVVMPGARSHVGGELADQTPDRDRGRKLILGERVRLPKDLESLDRTGLWILRQIPSDERRRVASAPPQPPPMLDTLTILRTPAGHVAWFDEFHGLRPAYWAWADYASEEEAYGTDPDWPKNQPGGRRPPDLPVPEVPGGERGAMRVLFRGRPAAAIQAESPDDRAG